MSNEDKFAKVHVIVNKWRAHKITSDEATKEIEIAGVGCEVMMILLSAAMITLSQLGNRR